MLSPLNEGSNYFDVRQVTDCLDVLPVTDTRTSAG